MLRTSGRGLARLAPVARSFSAVAQQPTQVTTLPNELRVASESTGGETATVGVWIDTRLRPASYATFSAASESHAPVW